jgi:hypothetical protein
MDFNCVTFTKFWKALNFVDNVMKEKTRYRTRPNIHPQKAPLLNAANEINSKIQIAKETCASVTVINTV